MNEKIRSLSFAERLLHWFDRCGRKDLPWQVDRSPYRVWVSEIMLQQTQVATVIPYFNRFMKRFPHVTSLAHATLEDVLHLWSGLGYYSRARNLHKSAQRIFNHYGGKFPSHFDDLVSLPGIGRSTAGAILALSMGERYAILDGNVKRVLCRYHAIEEWPGKASVEKKLWQLAHEQTPHDRIADYTQAIMDFGATLCKRHKPECSLCPLENDCLAHERGDEEKYPKPGKGKKIPMRRTHFLLVYSEEGHVLLEKRPPRGLWGGLWTMPQLSDLTEIGMWCKNNGLKVVQLETLDPFRHTFSHFRLHINPIKIKVLKSDSLVAGEVETLQWHSPDSIAGLGLPAPVRKLLL